MGADISELLNLIKAVNYYKAGGGNKKPGVGELFTAIGQGAAGVGQGLASAAQPKLALKELERQELDRKRGVAGKILDASLAHGENSYSSDQMNSILESGQFPSGVQISGGKEAKQSYIYDEATGTFKPGPAGVERNQILDVRPKAAPKTPGKGSSAATPQQRAWLSTLHQADTALSKGTLTDELRDAAKAAAKGLGVDPAIYAKKEAGDSWFAAALKAAGSAFNQDVFQPVYGATKKVVKAGVAKLNKETPATMDSLRNKYLK